MNRRKSTNHSPSLPSTEQLLNYARQVIDDSKNAILEFRRYQYSLSRRHDDFESSLPKWEKTLPKLNAHRGSLPWTAGELPHNGGREDSRTHNGTAPSKRNGNR